MARLNRQQQQQHNRGMLLPMWHDDPRDIGPDPREDQDVAAEYARRWGGPEPDLPTEQELNLMEEAANEMALQAERDELDSIVTDEVPES